MTENEELQFEEGRKSVWRSLLSEAVREIGAEDQALEGLIAERFDAVKKLREICAEYGDNDWDDDLRLADVIEKHLYRHLE